MLYVIKCHFLYSHLIFLPDNMRLVSDEYHKRFQQNVAVFKRRFQGRWEFDLLADNFWILFKDTPESQYKRKDSPYKKTMPFQ